MARYSPFVDSIVLPEEILGSLKPVDLCHPELLPDIREADQKKLTDEKPVRDEALFPLVRAGLFYALDALDESHRIIQDVSGDTGAYWHGMMHRREGDFDNARYWFRRAGAHPAFATLHGKGSALSPDVARQMNWDPYLFTGLCERAAFGEVREDLVPLQRAEFSVMFDYVWRHSVGG